MFPRYRPDIRRGIRIVVTKAEKGADPTTKNFYDPNLIFWIFMGCGEARFGRKVKKTPKIEYFGLKFVPWDLRPADKS